MLSTLRRGFTVVEILIVIVVIGILAGITTVSYKGLQARGAETASKNDASNVGEQLEQYFLKNNKFPSTIGDLGVLNTDSSSVITYNANDESFCLAVSRPGMKSYTIRDDANLAEGTCTGWVPTGPPGAPVASLGSVTKTSFIVSWGNVAGATSYTLQYGTSSPTSNAGCSTSPCTITGLTAGTSYVVRVTANNSSGSTASSIVSTTTTSDVPRNFVGTVTGCSSGAMYDIVSLQFTWSAPTSGITLQNYVVHSTAYPETGTFSTGPDAFYATTSGTTTTVSGTERNTGGTNTYRIHGVSGGVNTPDASITLSIPDC